MTNVENPKAESGAVNTGLTGVVVRQVGPDDWREWRAIRLAALEDAPWAFGSTLAQARTFGEDDWRRRLTGLPCYLADLPGVAGVAGVAGGPVGMSGAFIEEAGPGTARAGTTVELVSMWVSPEARGRGVGVHLVGAVVDWAARTGAARVHLWVTDGNDPARRLYERCGFVPTGERGPLPSDPNLSEIGMVRELPG